MSKDGYGLPASSPAFILPQLVAHHMGKKLLHFWAGSLFTRSEYPADSGDKSNSSSPSLTKTTNGIADEGYYNEM